MKVKLTKVIAVLFSMIVFLVGCGTNSSSSDDKKSVENTYTEKDIPLSEALPEYKIWYSFSSSEIHKDSIPRMFFYFDGKSVETYYLQDVLQSGLVSIENFDPIENLSISELLDMSEEEQLEYARERTSGSLKKAEFTGWAENFGVEIEQELNTPEKSVIPYQLNIITDGSGNNSSSEEFYYIANRIDEYLGNIEWKLSDKEKYSVIPNYGIKIPIYDYSLSGYATTKGLLLTEVGKDAVKFSLDTPQDKSKFITIDKKAK